MVGGFSYPASQLNRTTQSLRQPGSSIKHVVYLSALHRGLQPNTLVYDSGVTLPPIPGVSTHHWSPKNYEGGGSGVMTMRRALEQSKNMVRRACWTAVSTGPQRKPSMLWWGARSPGATGAAPCSTDEQSLYGNHSDGRPVSGAAALHELFELQRF
jgi:hypothetical protein